MGSYTAKIFPWHNLYMVWCLKPLGLSPAQELVENTVYWFENPKTFVPILGMGSCYWHNNDY